MTIEFYAIEGHTRVRESFVSPTIYLDHWALRLFSDERQLQDRLVDTLISQCGTLLHSVISFAEFARGDDRRHTLAAEEFVERLLPNIFLPILITARSVNKTCRNNTTSAGSGRRPTCLSCPESEVSLVFWQCLCHRVAEAALGQATSCSGFNRIRHRASLALASGIGFLWSRCSSFLCSASNHPHPRCLRSRWRIWFASARVS